MTMKDLGSLFTKKFGGEGGPTARVEASEDKPITILYKTQNHTMTFSVF